MGAETGLVIGSGTPFYSGSLESTLTSSEPVSSNLGLVQGEFFIRVFTSANSFSYASMLLQLPRTQLP